MTKKTTNKTTNEGVFSGIKDTIASKGLLGQNAFIKSKLNARDEQAKVQFATKLEQLLRSVPKDSAVAQTADVNETVWESYLSSFDSFLTTKLVEARVLEEASTNPRIAGSVPQSVANLKANRLDRFNKPTAPTSDSQVTAKSTGTPVPTTPYQVPTTNTNPTPTQPTQPQQAQQSAQTQPAGSRVVKTIERFVKTQLGPNADWEGWEDDLKAAAQSAANDFNSKGAVSSANIDNLWNILATVSQLQNRGGYDNSIIGNNKGGNSDSSEVRTNIGPMKDWINQYTSKLTGTAESDQGILIPMIAGLIKMAEKEKQGLGDAIIGRARDEAAKQLAKEKQDQAGQQTAVAESRKLRKNSV